MEYSKLTLRELDIEESNIEQQRNIINSKSFLQLLFTCGFFQKEQQLKVLDNKLDELRKECFKKLEHLSRTSSYFSYLKCSKAELITHIDAMKFMVSLGKDIDNPYGVISSIDKDELDIEQAEKALKVKQQIDGDFYKLAYDELENLDHTEFQTKRSEYRRLLSENSALCAETGDDKYNLECLKYEVLLEMLEHFYSING